MYIYKYIYIYIYILLSISVYVSSCSVVWCSTRCVELIKLVQPHTYRGSLLYIYLSCGALMALVVLLYSLIEIGENT